MNLRDRVDKNGKTDIKISVIILTYKNLALTIDCLESVLATKPKGMELELLILDNGSEDETESWLTYQDSLVREDGISFKAIFTGENLGFAGGCNEALKHATGDIIIFLNNDTIVTPGWISELIVPLILVDEIAFTAPVSNFSGGIQSIATTYKGQEEMLKFAKKNLIENHNKTEMAGMVTGLCLAGRRNTIDKLIGFHVLPYQLFDERFKVGMWEDNDLSLRVHLLGMKNLVCYGAFVHHEGSQTFKKIGDPKTYFYGNQKVFYKKWQSVFPDKDSQKIAVMIRVKDGEEFIDACLDSIMEWIDEVVILDTGSTDSTLDKIHAFDTKYPGKIILDSETFKSTPLKEFEEREHLLKLTQSRNPTWIIWMDVDHCWDKRITRYLSRLTCPTNPQILCWRFPILNFWRGREKFRVDGPWGTTAAHNMFRNLPGQKLITNDHPQGFHCSPVPIFQQHNIGSCGIPLLHYGYSDWEGAKKKYDYYTATDTDKRLDLIGGDGTYKHLIDENNLQLFPYYPNNFISLNMLVRDNEWDLALNTVNSLEMVVDQFVLVRTGEKEVSNDILARLRFRGRWVEVHDFEWEDNFSKARNFGLQFCQGRWILHLDPDESIPTKDIPFLSELIRIEFTKCWTFNIINYFTDPTENKTPEANIQSNAVRLFRNLPQLYYANPIHETLDDSVRIMKLKGSEIQKSNVTISHKGFLLSPEKFVAKMEYYADLNQKWLEESPTDPRPYYNLGIHHLDMDDIDKALEYLEQARELNNKGGYGLFQVGIALSGIYLNGGLDHTWEAFNQIPKDHPSKQRFQEMIDFLTPRIGKVRQFLKKYKDETQLSPPSVPPAIIPLLPFISKNMMGAEIGVQQGYSSELILKAGVRRLYCIDPWADREDYPECRGWTDFSIWKRQAELRLKEWVGTDRLHMIQKAGHDAVDEIQVPLDFVFIDGNHEYEMVAQDIEDWWPKIKPGGFLAGHDYYPSPDKFHRVQQAVDEWAKKTGAVLRVFKDCWLVHKEK